MIELLILLVMIVVVIFSIFCCGCIIGLTQFLLKVTALTKVACAFMLCTIAIILFLMIGYLIRMMVSLVTYLTESYNNFNF